MAIQDGGTRLKLFYETAFTLTTNAGGGAGQSRKEDSEYKTSSFRPLVQAGGGGTQGSGVRACKKFDCWNAALI